ncbi:hypothetical protein DXG01_002796 [Tephrocybe rancida]|nr:hypothetical protein DXG01_002796 [Tephrocybe rancida]
MAYTLNPFHNPNKEYNDPVNWSPAVVKALVVDTVPCFRLARKPVPDASAKLKVPMADVDEYVQKLKTLRDAGFQDDAEITVTITDLIGYMAFAAAYDRGAKFLENDPALICINSLEYCIDYNVACNTDGVTVARYTDSFTRVEERRQADPNAKRIPQDAKNVDAMDVATLIALARELQI